MGSLTKTQIRKLGKIVTGKTPPTKVLEYFGAKYPFITPSDISDYTIKYLNTTERYLSEEGKKYQKSLQIPENTVCFVAIGSTVGKMCFTKSKSFTNQQIHSIIVDEKNYDPHYVFYKIHYEYPKIKSIADANGSGKPIINKSDFSNIEIEVDDLPTQQKIALILSTYDDLIENNTRRIKILEEMAQTIYKEWFVNFRFPGHEKVKFVDSSLGKIPEGWEVKDLINVANILMGQSPKSEFYNEDDIGLPFHQGVTDFGFRFPEHSTFCSVQNRIAEKLDILFSVRAPVGRINIANSKLIIGRGLSAIRHKDNLQSYLFYLLKNTFTIEDTLGSGAIFNSVTKDDMYKIKVIKPSNEFDKHFNELIEPIDSQIENLNSKISNLRKTRDLLLPKLMSGEVEL